MGYLITITNPVTGKYCKFELYYVWKITTAFAWKTWKHEFFSYALENLIKTLKVGNISKNKRPATKTLNIELETTYNIWNESS